MVEIVRSDTWNPTRRDPLSTREKGTLGGAGIGAAVGAPGAGAAIGAAIGGVTGYAIGNSMQNNEAAKKQTPAQIDPEQKEIKLQKQQLAPLKQQ